MGGYLVFLMISTATFALVALGLNLQWGFTGLINFGHVAFMTIGAYTTVLLSVAGVPILVAVPVGMALGAILGLLVGLSTLRLREDYLAIVTIGVSEMLRLVAQNEEWLTKGSFGVQGFPLPLERFNPNLLGKLGMMAVFTAIALLGAWRLWRWFLAKTPKPQIDELGNAIPLADNRIRPWMYQFLFGFYLLFGGTLYIYGMGSLWDYNYKAGLMVLVLIAFVVVYWLLEQLIHSPWGRVLKAIREDEAVAKALGKNVFWYKLQSLMLGGAIASLSGAFYAWQLTAIYPDNFKPQLTFDTWTMVVLGGAANNAGVLLGSVIFCAYDAITRFVLPNLVPLDDARLGAFRIMVIGLLLMLLMVWRPQGILGKKEELTLGR